MQHIASSDHVYAVYLNLKIHFGSVERIRTDYEGRVASFGCV